MIFVPPNTCVDLGVLMTCWTMCLCCIDVANESRISTLVLRSGHWLKMIRIDAPLHATEVIYFNLIIERPVQCLPKCAMGRLDLSLDRESGVPLRWLKSADPAPVTAHFYATQNPVNYVHNCCSPFVIFALNLSFCLLVCLCGVAGTRACACACACARTRGPKLIVSHDRKRPPRSDHLRGLFMIDQA